jgi:hypothetical protein
MITELRQRYSLTGFRDHSVRANQVAIERL